MRVLTSAFVVSAIHSLSSVPSCPHHSKLSADKVFKVETIGDCYVAFTGLPNPQPNHAVVMVEFARDCYTKMGNILPKLAESLGQDTTSIAFRVGLHSGPVTGGVLRGQKAKFQLFGDTINTASRMESNGVSGRIHISQATADELKDKGCGHWAVPREDKIVAKGKGEMQTYFVDFQNFALSASALSSSSGSKGDHGDSNSMITLGTDTCGECTCTDVDC